MVDTHQHRFLRYQFALIGLFTFFLLFPTIGYILSEKADTSFVEKRKLSEFPSISLEMDALKAFPRKFEKYVEDRFGFRDKFIYLHNLIKIRVFEKSTVSSVALGKEGWLFWAKAKIFEDYRGKIPFKASELYAWKTVFENRQKWLSEQGIQYFYVIPPNKHTIYNEYLPDYVSKQKGETRLEQFVSYFEKNSTVPVIDLRAALFEAKKKKQVYYRTDIHWNFAGGYVGYQNIMESLLSHGLDLSVIPEDSILEREAGKIGDLAQYMGLDDYFNEKIPVICLQHTCAKEIPISIANLNISRYYSSGCKHKEKVAVVFRDSFFNYIIPFLSESFKQVVYLWKPYNHVTMKMLIETIKPDVVIDERLQRYLTSPPPLEDGEMNRGVDFSSLTKQETLIKLDPSNDFKNIKANDQVSLTLSSAGLKITATGTDPSVYIPKFHNSTQQDNIIIRIKIESPGDTVMQLFYKTHSDPYFTEGSSFSKPIKKGLNDLYLQTSMQNMIGELRLDPGILPGKYTLHEFSVNTIEWL